MATTPDTDLPLTEQFLRYGRYVRNWSPRTVECYRQALRDCPATITKANLNTAVVAMRERGLTPGGINLRARAINSYLTWLHEDGHVAERLKIKMLRNPPNPNKFLVRYWIVYEHTQSGEPPFDAFVLLSDQIRQFGFLSHVLIFLESRP
jgi:hypothetical protein